MKKIFIFFILMGFTATSFAAQFDAPFMKAQQENKANWSKEDKALDKKLAPADIIGENKNDIRLLAKLFF